MAAAKKTEPTAAPKKTLSAKVSKYAHYDKLQG